MSPTGCLSVSFFFDACSFPLRFFPETPDDALLFYFPSVRVGIVLFRCARGERGVIVEQPHNPVGFYQGDGLHLSVFFLSFKLLLEGSCSPCFAIVALIRRWSIAQFPTF